MRRAACDLDHILERERHRQRALAVLPGARRDRLGAELVGAELPVDRRAHGVHLARLAEDQAKGAAAADLPCAVLAKGHRVEARKGRCGAHTPQAALPVRIRAGGVHVPVGGGEERVLGAGRDVHHRLAFGERRAKVALAVELVRLVEHGARVEATLPRAVRAVDVHVAVERQKERVLARGRRADLLHAHIAQPTEDRGRCDAASVALPTFPTFHRVRARSR